MAFDTSCFLHLESLPLLAIKKIAGSSFIFLPYVCSWNFILENKALDNNKFTFLSLKDHKNMAYCT